jgi:glutamyl-tRNA synthetase
MGITHVVRGRGVDFVHAQAPLALSSGSGSKPPVRAYAAAAQCREVQDLQAQESRGPPHLVREQGYLPRLSSTSLRCRPIRRPRGRRHRRREVFTFDEFARASLVQGQPGRTDLRPEEARLAQRRLHPRVGPGRLRSRLLPYPRGRRALGQPVAGRARATQARRGADPDPDRPAHRGCPSRGPLLHGRRHDRDRRRCPRPAWRRSPAVLDAAIDVLSGDIDDHLAGLSAGRDWNAATIEAAFARDRRGPRKVKARVAFGPLRTAVSGARISPPLFESMEILGKTSTLARLHAARPLSSWPGDRLVRPLGAPAVAGIWIALRFTLGPAARASARRAVIPHGVWCNWQH